MRALDWPIMKKGAREIVQRGFVLYGASSTGDKMIDYLRDMGLLDKIVAVIDSDEKKWGKIWNSYEVYSPKKLEDIENDITIVITSVFIKEIFEYLRGQGYENNILSAGCFRLGIHFDIMCVGANQYLDVEVIERYKLKYEVWSRTIKQCEDFSVIYANNQKAVAEFPVVVLLHGIQKTGNSTLVKSFKKTNNVVVTTHRVYGDEASLKEWKEVMRIFDQHEIRIITGIREPIEREISAM